MSIEGIEYRVLVAKNDSLMAAIRDLMRDLVQKDAEILALEEANLRGSGCDYCDCVRCLGRKTG